MNVYQVVDVLSVFVCQGGRPMYLQLDAVRALTASAIIRILDANRWYSVSIISEDTYADDGFVDAFKALTTDSSRSRTCSSSSSSSGNGTAVEADWSVEDYIRVSRRSTRDEVDKQLLALLENQSRVIVLHSRLELATRAPYRSRGHSVPSTLTLTLTHPAVPIPIESGRSN